MNKINFSPALFFLTIFSFFLPFVSINCSDTKLQQFSGFDLAVGQKLKSDNPSYSGKVPKNKTIREWPATLALIASIAGLIFSLVAFKKRILLAFAGAVSSLSLIYLMGKISSEINDSQYGNVLRVDFLFGWGLALLVSLVITGLNVYLFSVEKNRS